MDRITWDAGNAFRYADDAIQNAYNVPSSAREAPRNVICGSSDGDNLPRDATGSAAAPGFLTSSEDRVSSRE
jgi:hypothetical protein